MKIYIKSHASIYEVYAIQLSIDQYPPGNTSVFPAEKNVVFYASDEDTYGFVTADISSCEIVDPSIGNDFKFEYDPENSTAYIYWNYFRDLEHVGVIAYADIDPEAMKAFNIAIKNRES